MLLFNASLLSSEGFLCKPQSRSSLKLNFKPAVSPNEATTVTVCKFTAFDYSLTCFMKLLHFLS